MRIRTISVALGLSAAVVLTLLFVGPGQDTARGTGTGPFGDGSDGPMTFSSSAQFDPPADAVVDSGSNGGTALTVSGVTGTFVAGDRILIHQTRGIGAGTWELNSVQSYALGNIVTATALASSYTTSGADAAQVLVVPEYTNVTVNNAVTLSSKPWNGATGGILAFLANDTVTVTGTITASEKGYRGGAPTSTLSFQGEGTGGAGTPARDANGNGGGGGENFDANNHPGGGGGGHATAGTAGSLSSNGQGIAGSGGDAAGSVDLTTMVFGGGGGARGVNPGSPDAGDGGGIVLIYGLTITVSGSISTNGQDLSGGGNGHGGGAGGAILIKGQTITLGGSLFTATGGAGGTSQDANNGAGGPGADGLIRVEYCGAVPTGGTADPPASLAAISCDSKPIENVLTITNVYQNPLPKSCFDVMDSGQTFLFSVCDNDFQGTPNFAPPCDAACSDEDPALGSIRVTVDPGIYHVEVSKVPLNITADTTKGVCSGGPACELTFTSTSFAKNQTTGITGAAKPWFPWDVAGPNDSWPPDGIVDLTNDIFGVIQHYCPVASDPCAKP